MYKHEKLTNVVTLNIKEIPNGKIQIILQYGNQKFESFVSMIENLTEEKCENLDWLHQS